jgi:hypothetical protein
MKEALSQGVSVLPAPSIDATPADLPAEASFLDRLPPALVTDLRQITNRRETPFRGLSLQDVITEFLPLLDQLGHLGATGAELAIVLAELGLRAPDGAPYARGTISKAMSRARQASASGKLRQSAATCGRMWHAAASSGNLRQDAAPPGASRPDAALSGAERRDAASGSIPRLHPQPESSANAMRPSAARSADLLRSLRAEDDI